MAMEPVLKQRNKVGYVAARNTRLLKDTLTEYLHIKEELIHKYGEKDEAPDGMPSPHVSVKLGTENFKNFMEEFSTIKDIEHEISLMTLKYDEVIGVLSGEEILKLDWMLEE